MFVPHSQARDRTASGTCPRRGAFSLPVPVPCRVASVADPSRGPHSLICTVTRCESEGLPLAMTGTPGPLEPRYLGLSGFQTHKGAVRSIFPASIPLSFFCNELTPSFAQLVSCPAAPEARALQHLGQLPNSQPPGPSSAYQGASNKTLATTATLSPRINELNYLHARERGLQREKGRKRGRGTK